MKTVIGDKRWSKKYPEVGTGPVSIEPNISPELFELEKERIWQRCWLNVGRIERVANPGDYFVTEIAPCNASILVTHARDGVIRAFHNVCSHRCNRLVWDEQGRGSTFTCSFHCWTYDDHGALRAVTDESNFHDLDKSKLGLTPVAIDQWLGFLFINLDAEPTETLEEYLGGVAEDLAGADFGKYTQTFQYIAEERANWKTILDAQNELYHLPFQHRNTASDLAVLKDGLYTRLLDVRLHGKHTIYSSEVHQKEGTTPLNKLQSTHSRGALRLPIVGDFEFYSIFPNFVILLTHGEEYDFFTTYNIWPTAVDQTRWEICTFGLPPQNAEELFALEFQKCYTRDTLLEDVIAHEQTQLGLASRAKTHFYFQDEEIQLRHFHNVWEEMCGVKL
jgi:phenylpropionate dioxygenase-like ring-hydroxylating dioxygenase large terminal subunit